MNNTFQFFNFGSFKKKNLGEKVFFFYDNFRGKYWFSKVTIKLEYTLKERIHDFTTKKFNNR